jgi:hypothetical protein
MHTLYPSRKEVAKGFTCANTSACSESGLKTWSNSNLNVVMASR